MGKIKVNLQGAKPSPQQQPQQSPQEYPSFDGMAATGFNSSPPSAAYGYPPRQGMFYEPQRNSQQSHFRQPQQQEQYQQQQQYGNRSRQPRQPQPSAAPHHPFYSNYSADPFGQYFAPGPSPSQQRSQQQQQQSRHHPSSGRQSSQQQQQQSHSSARSHATTEPAASVPSRHEGGLLQESGKQYSIASTQTFTKLDTIKAKYNDLLSKVNTIETTTNKEETESLHKSKNLLAQISGDIDRLQFTGLDAIDTSILHTGKDEARNKRKKLNHDIEELQQHVQDLHKIYEEMGSKMTQHENDRQMESGNTTTTDSEEEVEGSDESDAQMKAPLGGEEETSPEAEAEASFPDAEQSSEESGEMKTEDVPATAEGNLPSSAECNEIEQQRTEDAEDDKEEIVGESAETPCEATEETKDITEKSEETPTEETPTTTTAAAAAAAAAEEEEIIPSVDPGIDMTDWVIEDSSPAPPSSSSRDPEVLKLEQLLSEKDELIRQLREQLVEKDKLLAEYQQPESRPDNAGC